MPVERYEVGGPLSKSYVTRISNPTGTEKELAEFERMTRALNIDSTFAGYVEPMERWARAVLGEAGLPTSRRDPEWASVIVGPPPERPTEPSEQQDLNRRMAELVQAARSCGATGELKFVQMRCNEDREWFARQILVIIDDLRIDLSEGSSEQVALWSCYLGQLWWAAVVKFQYEKDVVAKQKARRDSVESGRASHGDKEARAKKAVAAYHQAIGQGRNGKDALFLAKKAVDFKITGRTIERYLTAQSVYDVFDAAMARGASKEDAFHETCIAHHKSKRENVQKILKARGEKSTDSSW